MNKIKFIYFDLGGVFFHWRGGMEIVAKKIGVTFEDLEKVRIKYDDLVCRGKMTTAELWGKFQEELNFNSPEDFKFPEDWVKTFTSIPETHALVTEIIKKYPVGILTNVFSGVYEIQTKNNLVPDLKYYPVIKSCDYGLVKPGKEIYKIAQQEAGADPSEILYTDDTKINIESAKSLGWNTVLFNEYNPEKSIEEITLRLRLH